MSTAEGLLDRVREVVPLIAERAPSAEQARKPDDDVIEALKRTGVRDRPSSSAMRCSTSRWPGG
jgi:hypothetical protein